MNAYLVRVADTRELVGFYFSENEIALSYLVDEIIDPTICECAEIEAGGVCWEGVGPSVPDKRRIAPLPEPSLTEGWAELIDRDNDLLWLPVPSWIEAQVHETLATTQ